VLGGGAQLPRGSGSRPLPASAQKEGGEGAAVMRVVGYGAQVEQREPRVGAIGRGRAGKVAELAGD
jgi:hypothetical protein